MPAATYRRPPGHSSFRAGPLVQFIVERRDGRDLRELAAVCGIGESTLYRLLNGHTTMVRLDTADRVTMGLGGHLDYVYPHDEPVCQRDLTHGTKGGRS